MNRAWWSEGCCWQRDAIRAAGSGTARAQPVRWTRTAGPDDFETLVAWLSHGEREKRGTARALRMRLNTRKRRQASSEKKSQSQLTTGCADAGSRACATIETHASNAAAGARETPDMPWAHEGHPQISADRLRIVAHTCPHCARIPGTAPRFTAPTLASSRSQEAAPAPAECRPAAVARPTRRAT